MKILVVDDSEKNLVAAKEAAINFSGHEFYFTNSAREAVEILTEYDVVITDLFFPDEGHANGGILDTVYAIYRTAMRDNPVFDQVLWSYYRGERRRANDALANARDLMEDGTIRGAIMRLIHLYEEWGNQEEKIGKYREFLEDLPVPQFPYGAALMLDANCYGKGVCLVSDIHRHGSSFEDAPTTIDGMVLLLPLMEAGIISVKQAERDGRESLTYLGCDEIRRVGKDKADPAVWSEAIRRILAQ